MTPLEWALFGALTLAYVLHTRLLGLRASRLRKDAHDADEASTQCAMPPGSEPRPCNGIPPNHPADECPACDEINSTLWIENHRRQREARPLLRADDPDLYRKLYGVE